jgi:hypothetical protein
MQLLLICPAGQHQYIAGGLLLKPAIMMMQLIVTQLLQLYFTVVLIQRIAQLHTATPVTAF